MGTGLRGGGTQNVGQEAQGQCWVSEAGQVLQAGGGGQQGAVRVCVGGCRTCARLPAGRWQPVVGLALGWEVTDCRVVR